MWFKIAKLCIVLVTVQIIEGKPNFGLRTNVPPVGIINGKEAVENQFPYQVATISYFDSNGMKFQCFCGGSLISTTAVLTSAQCLKFSFDEIYDAVKVDIHLGSLSWPSKNVVTVSNKSSIKVHPDFNTTTKTGDLALIILPTAIKPSKSVKPIDLDFSSKDHAKEAAIVAGWGQTEDNGDVPAPKLRYVDLKVISNDECKKSFSFLNENHICTAASNDKNEHVGLCGGDAGGPLVSADGKQIGIASFIGPKSCEDPSYPSGYTRVSKYADWIKKILNSTY